MKFVTKRKKKTVVYVPINKISIMVVMLLTGFFWTSLTVGFCVKHPTKAIIYASALGVQAHRVQRIISKTKAKLVPEFIKKPYNKYFRNVHALTNEVCPKVAGDPKPSILVRVSNGFIWVGSKLLFWV